MNRKYRKTVIAGNWKMNQLASTIKPFMEELKVNLPKAKNCDIKKNFDKSVTMAKWAEGDYYYTISATDAAGNSSMYNRFFTIRASYPATAPREPDWSDVATEIAEPVVDSAATLVDPVPPEE